MQHSTHNGKTIRFNLPTADGQKGMIQIAGGDILSIEVADGICLGDVVWMAGPAHIWLSMIDTNQLWREIAGPATPAGPRRTHRHPAKLLAEILIADHGVQQ
jgi:hypothetical protein